LQLLPGVREGSFWKIRVRISPEKSWKFPGIRKWIDGGGVSGSVSVLVSHQSVTYIIPTIYITHQKWRF